MSSQDLEALRQAITAINRGDVEAALAVGAEDVVLIPLRAATEGAYHGHTGLRAFFADTAETFELFRLDIGELRDLDGRILVTGTVHIRTRGSRVETDIPSAGIASFRQGKLVRWEDFGDVERAVEAAGLAA